MKQSFLFTKTRRQAPADEVSKNAQLLIRAGYIHKEMAGVYDFLPLGLKVLGEIHRIIREEMNAIGGQEVFLSVLQNKELWERTGRWSDTTVDNWFKTRLKNDAQLGLGFTHEEPITHLMRDHLRSYKDLPLALYQIQTKFRNELRAKSGIMRGREFFMKDMYSFSRTDEEHDAFYARCAEAYMRIFSRVGLGDITYKTFASGGVFSKYSHEFQTLSNAGEDTVYVHKEKGIAVNKEVYTDEVCAELGVSKEEMVEEKAIEVGNIFSLGTRFSEALGLTYKDEAGRDAHPRMGCYGIGPARLMGTIVETYADEKGLVWPAEVAPFRVHLVELPGSDEVRKESEELYKELVARGTSVLWDDRDLRAGEKFADSDLLGIPLRVVVSEKTIAAGAFECVTRASGKVEQKTVLQLMDTLASHA